VQKASLPDLTTEVTDELTRFGDEVSSPLWAQLKSKLLEMLSSGDLKPHDKLPSASELCRRFGVSRTVVREALNQLVFERRIYKMQGKGSFVSEPSDDQDFVGSTISFTSDFVGTNKIVSRQVLFQGLQEVTPEIQDKLRLGAAETEAVVLDRVLCVDGEPRTRVLAILRRTAVPGLETTSMENRSLYETLRRRYGIVLTSAERWIEARSVDEKIASLLNVPVGAAVLGIESISSDQTGQVVELYYATHRTHRAKLHFFVK
jgi:GntR family transcriptional regulator